MVERASTLDVRTDIETVREPSRPFFHARRLGRRLRRSERGTAVVEFAIVAIPLFLIVFGILDFGRALNYYNDLTQLAGQGARAAAVNQDPNGGSADASFQTQLACSATTGELKGGINVNVSTTPVNPGDPVKITTSFTFHFFPFLTQYIGLTLSAAQSERYESSSAPSYNRTNDVTGGVTGC
jgi:TadE-like protein